MRTNSIAAIALLLATSAFARDHHMLDGTWRLVPARSDFAGQPVVQTGTVTIEDRQGIISITRNFVYDGAHQTYFYKDNTGSENHATIHSGKDFKTRTKWDHDFLKVITTQSGAVSIESYSLTPDGTMTVTVDKPGQKPFTLLFHRQS